MLNESFPNTNFNTNFIHKISDNSMYITYEFNKW